MLVFVQDNHDSGYGSVGCSLATSNASGTPT